MMLVVEAAKDLSSRRDAELSMLYGKKQILVATVVKPPERGESNRLVAKTARRKRWDAGVGGPAGDLMPIGVSSREDVDLEVDEQLRYQ